MPRFTGQNKKRIDPRYFLNEKTDITRMDTLQDSGELESTLMSISLDDLLDIVEPYLEDDEKQRILQTRREDQQAVVIDIIKMMPDAEGEEIYDLVAASGSKNRTQVDEGMLSQMMGGAFVEVGDPLTVDGYEVQVTDVIRDGQAIEVAFLDTKDGHETATAVWNGSEWELARS